MRSPHLLGHSRSHAPSLLLFGFFVLVFLGLFLFFLGLGPDVLLHDRVGAGIVELDEHAGDGVCIFRIAREGLVDGVERGQVALDGQSANGREHDLAVPGAEGL